MISTPSPPPHSVDRLELLARLDAALDAPLSLLVAPAGSGKTVLLSQWGASRPDLRFLWLEADHADDDPAEFLRRLLRGLSQLAPNAVDLAPLLSIGAGGLGLPLLESLVVLLADHPGTVLIFDDLHNLSNRAIIEDLWWLADHLPPGTHMVLSSRVDLRLAWSRHRLRYALLELRQAELAFDADIVGEVVHRIAGSAATPATVSAVMESTEGWAAGVQLTAISLRHQSDPEHFAQRLAGTDRLISDYLSEEVLGAQTESRQALLLRMSALDAMSPGLVETVLDVSDAGDVFDELQRDSMFLVPLDGQREWFRFHHLFRDLLRYRLRARQPDDELRILEAAADWHEAHGDLASAIEYLLRARSWDRSLDLILAHGREVFELGYAASVSRWLSLVPEAERLKRPLAEAMLGYTLGRTGQPARSEDVLRRLVARPDLPGGEHVITQVFLSALVQFRPDVSVSLETAQEAVRLLRETDGLPIPDLMGLTDPTLLQAMALGSLARAHFLTGDLPNARRWMLIALGSPGAQYSAYRVHLLGSMALLEAWSGRLARAEALSDEGLDLAREVGLLRHPAPADAYLARALVAIHRANPHSSSLALHEGTLRAASNRRTQLMWVAHLESVLAEEGAEGGGPEPVGEPAPIVAQALEAAALRMDRLARRAGPPLAEMPSDALGWTPVTVEFIAGALADRRADHARALLERTGFSPHADTPLATVEHGVLTAWLAHLEGRSGECRRRLTGALDLASEHGLVAVFLWSGPEVIKLIEALPGPPDPFRTQVLQKAREMRRNASDDRLGEPLTDRERELLVFLPTRLTNAELAAELFVSVNTIKTHMAHIYRKLDAPNRSAAVSRASELGLL